MIRIAILLIAIAPLAARDDISPETKKRPEVFSDVESAGPDARIQGEYRGESTRAGKIGAQIIAEGDGRFVVRLLKGGLPGGGWDGQSQLRLEAKTTDGVVAFDSKGYRGELQSGSLKLKRNDETVILERVERTSPTLGIKPPEGAVVLFDGQGTEAWQNGRVVNGAALSAGAKSKQLFGDFTLHLEFQTPFAPRVSGQDRGNSGVYLQGRYEVQILDSFGLPEKNNECGAIYEVAAPKVNMSSPPLTWQTFDIEFTAARFDPGKKKLADAVVTVKHNGVVVHDRVKIPKPTGLSEIAEDGAPGPIALQDHGNPVIFRNIWLVERK